MQAPEYKSRGELSTKVDTFAFGLVMLEAITSLPVDFSAASLVSEDPRMKLLLLPPHVPYPVKLLELWKDHIGAPGQLAQWVDPTATCLGEIVWELFHTISSCLEDDPQRRVHSSELIPSLEQARSLARALDDGMSTSR